MKLISIVISQILFITPIVFAMASSPSADPNAPQPPAWVQIVPIAVMFLIIYMLMIRPQVKQKKQHEGMIGSLKKGDRVVTRGGLIGTIVNTSPGILDIKLNEDTKVKIQQDAISGLYVEKPQEPEVVGKTKKQ